MLYITKIIKKIISKDLPNPLGRWKIENCLKKINNKIDLSNEDHCGPCGQYAIKKLELNNHVVIHKNSENSIVKLVKK